MGTTRAALPLIESRLANFLIKLLGGDSRLMSSTPPEIPVWLLDKVNVRQEDTCTASHLLDPKDYERDLYNLLLELLGVSSSILIRIGGERGIVE
jgi:hypothetical protein